MKIGKKLKTVLLCGSLLAVSIPCLANITPVSGSDSQKNQQEEAIVIRIDQNNVTLQDAGDKDKKRVAPFSNAAEFKVGDRVVLQGNMLKKVSQDMKASPTDNR